LLRHSGTLIPVDNGTPVDRRMVLEAELVEEDSTMELEVDEVVGFPPGEPCVEEEVDVIELELLGGPPGEPPPGPPLARTCAVKAERRMSEMLDFILKASSKV
jgi:hypothetical protein